MALSDTDLILKAQDGSVSAFEELVRRYDRQVLSIALKFTGDRDDAKDIYQDVFIRIFRGIKNFRFQSELSTWIFRITTNVCLTYRSRQSKKSQISISGNEDEEKNSFIMNLESNEKDHPDKISLDSETARNIEMAMNQLTAKQKICFTLKLIEGYKSREIAVMLGCKEGTVKKYLFDAIRKVRKSLKEFSYDGV